MPSSEVRVLEQDPQLDGSPFHRECERIFHIMDKDESGFLKTSELEGAVAQLIPDSSSGDDDCLVQSIQSVLSSFNRDSQRQLSPAEFPDLVRFCYAWRKQQSNVGERESCGSQSKSRNSRMRRSLSLPCGAAHSIARDRSRGCSDFSKSLPATAREVSRDAGCTFFSQTMPARSFPEIRPRSCSLPQRSSHAPAKPAESVLLPRRHSLPEIVQLPPCTPPRASTPSKSSSISPTFLPIPGRSTSKLRQPRSASSTCLPSPFASPVPSVVSSARKSNLSVSPSGVKTACSSRCPSKSSSAPSSRKSSKAPTRHASRRPSKVSTGSDWSGSSGASGDSNSQASSKASCRRDDLPAKQMKALEALLKNLVQMHTSLSSLVFALVSKVLTPDSTCVFSKDLLDHICRMVTPASKPSYSPKSYGPVATTEELAQCISDLGHDRVDSVRNVDEDAMLIDQAIDAVMLLSIRWIRMEDQLGVPEMTDYQRQKWLPASFSYLTGQILWRHRCNEQLSAFTSTVENLSWVTTVPELEKDTMDDCNAVFNALCGGDSARLKVTQWRRVMDIIASNSELRPLVRRCNAVKACYCDEVAREVNGLSRRSFKIMLAKSADLMNLHPCVLFKELASHASEFRECKKVLSN